jgi:hypothetical protein
MVQVFYKTLLINYAESLRDLFHRYMNELFVQKRLRASFTRQKEENCSGSYYRVHRVKRSASDFPGIKSYLRLMPITQQLNFALSTSCVYISRVQQLVDNSTILACAAESAVSPAPASARRHYLIVGYYVSVRQRNRV